MGRIFILGVILIAISGLALWGISRITLPTVAVHKSTSLSASALSSQSKTNAFDQTGTIVIDHSDGGPNGVPYILYTPYSESGKASIATKRLVFAGDVGCQASALPCATRPTDFPVEAGQQVHIVGVVDAQNVFVENLSIISEPAVPVGS